MVEPHLLVAVRFPPTREGSGTKGTGRRPQNRAFFQVSPQYVGSWVLPFLLGLHGCIYFQHTWSSLSVSSDHRLWKKYSSSFTKSFSRSFSSIVSVMQRQLPFIQTVRKTGKVPQMQFLDCVLDVPVVLHAVDWPLLNG